jgi:large subunit ribosomal protein L28
MSRRCEITGRAVLYGNNVSHANNKKSRRFLPNLQNISFLSEALNMKFRLRVSARGIRCVEAGGGLDSFLLNSKTANLGDRAKSIKKIIESKQRV